MVMTAMIGVWAMAVAAMPPVVQVELGQKKPNTIQIIRGKPSKPRSTQTVPQVIEVAPPQTSPAPAVDAAPSRAAPEQQQAEVEKQCEPEAQAGQQKAAQKKTVQEREIRKQGAAVHNGFQDAANALAGE